MSSGCRLDVVLCLRFAVGRSAMSSGWELDVVLCLRVGGLDVVLCLRVGGWA